MTSLDYNRPEVCFCKVCNKQLSFPSALSRHKRTKAHKARQERFEAFYNQQLLCGPTEQNQVINQATVSQYLPPVRNLHSTEAYDLDKVGVPDNLFETPNISEHVQREWRKMPQKKRPIIYDAKEQEWHVKTGGEWKSGEAAERALTEYAYALQNAAQKHPSVRDAMFGDPGRQQEVAIAVMGKIMNSKSTANFQNLTERMIHCLTYK